MKESEYIDATDLARLRAAYETLSGTTTGGPLRAPVFVALAEWIEEVESRLRGKLEE